MNRPTPARRHPPAVYRRRRIVVLLVALLVVGGVIAGTWALVAQPWSGAQQPVPQTSSPAATPTPSASLTEAEPEAEAIPTPEPEPTLGACSEDTVAVTATTDKDVYAAGEIPQLGIRLQNTSEHPCTVNVGSSQQVFIITSGADTWWRSTDCQVEPSDMEITLEAQQELTTTVPVPWDRTRSAVDTCEGDRPAAPSGGASYHLDVSIGGIPASQTKQFILG